MYSNRVPRQTGETEDALEKGAKRPIQRWPSILLFPQQMRGEQGKWLPNFLDYLFLAFNHSTAFSPTDTAVLSRRAKVLVMVQATLSLMAVAVLVSKAINSL